MTFILSEGARLHMTERNVYACKVENREIVA